MYWVTLFKYLRVFQTFGVLFVVMVKMVYQFVLFISVYFIITVGFAGALAIQYHPEINNFRSWPDAIVILVRMTFGGADFNQFTTSPKVFALLVLILYAVVSVVMLLNLLIAMFNGRPYVHLIFPRCL